MARAMMLMMVTVMMPSLYGALTCNDEERHHAGRLAERSCPVKSSRDR